MRDYSIQDDASEDGSWNGVWEVGTRIDSLGWTAEFRIPLSQLRYPRADEHVFGFMVVRDVGRSNERSSWPLLRRSSRGISSQFGELSGLRGLGSPRRLEATPYVVARSEPRPALDRIQRAQGIDGGADVKIGLTSNLTLDLTVNPDFGQVEADPAVLNLSAFETFFEERRPFFLEGTDIFRFGSFSQLFYSRRIGRAPQLAGLVDEPFAHIPGSSTIQGAAKLTGRFGDGTSVGTLVARVGAERVTGILVEPATTFGVARARRDFRDGESTLGAIFTTVHRDLDATTEPFLRRSAMTGGVDGRHRFAGGSHEARAAVAMSHVEGSEAAIARTQRSSVHYFQRPDAGLDYDPTRTSLSGTAAEARVEKVTGEWRWATRGLYRAPGFELNDVGYLQRSDWLWGMGDVTYRSTRPRSTWRTASGFAAHWLEYDARGTPNANSIELGWQMELHNRLRLSADSWFANIYPSYCDRCARGGPAVRRSPQSNLLVSVAGDSRSKVIPSVSAIYTITDEGRSTLWRVRPYVTVQGRSDLRWELGTRYQRNKDNTQWITNRGVIGADTTQYVFGRLDQHLLSFTARLDYTVSPTLSLQLYAEPFVTTGSYSDLRELDEPRAARYDDRFRPARAVTSGSGFNQKQFRSNAVVRWEYRPGSALFVVWQQARDQWDRDLGNFEAARDYRNLFAARPENVLLVKGTYWLSW
jgi:hypothetical protein